PGRRRAVHDRRRVLRVAGGGGVEAPAGGPAAPTIQLVPRRLAILGSTGSIGVQALDVVLRSEGELQVVALSAAEAWEPLLEQARRHGVQRIALADPDAAARAGEAWTGEVRVGSE